jgi:hypothetical protein
VSHLDREDRTRLAAGENDELPPPPKVADADDQPDAEERFAPGDSQERTTGT